MKNKLLLTATFFLAALIIFLVAKNKVQERGVALVQDHAEQLVRGHAYKVGADNSKVTLVEFLDPECESCRMMYPVVKNFLNLYKDQIQLVIRYAALHPNSKMAIKILEAARVQGKYEEALETLFRYQPVWGDHHNPRPDLIWGYLGEIEGLDLARVRLEMNSEEISKIIEQDTKDAHALGVKATPSFFVNGKPLQRFGVNHLQQLIESEL